MNDDWQVVDTLADGSGKTVQIAHAEDKVRVAITVAGVVLWTIVLDGEGRDAFMHAFAVAERQAEAFEAVAGDACWHCRKPIVRCDSVPSHFGCGSGHGWIHGNPEQWGHSCEPRSGAPYARPDAELASPSQPSR